MYCGLSGLSVFLARAFGLPIAVDPVNMCVLVWESK